MEDFGHKLHQIFSLVGSDLGQFKLETQFTTYIVDRFVELINQFCFNNEHPFSFLESLTTGSLETQTSNQIMPVEMKKILTGLANHYMVDRRSICFT